MDLGHTFRALRHRNYRLFFIGQGISLLGTWLQQVAMSWLAYRLTGSALFLGVVAFCSNISILLFSTVAGVIADRVERRTALLVTQGMMLVQAALLAWLTATGRIEVWHIVVLSLWLGTISAFDLPLRQSMYAELVEDRDDLGNAIALNSLLINGTRVIGPALAGALLVVASEALCFGLNALSFVAVLVAIACIRWPARADRAAPVAWWSSWIEGARYAIGFRPLRASLIFVAALAWTLGPYSALMPVFAARAYGGGAQTLGWLLSAAGAGSLVCAFYLAQRRSIVGMGSAIVIAAIVSGAAMAAFSQLHWLPAGLALMTLVGGGMTLAAAGMNLLLQTVVEDKMRGRVAGFYTLAFGGVMPLGSLAAGEWANLFGAPAAFFANGLLAVLAALWFWRQLAPLRAEIRGRMVALGLFEEP